MKILYKGSFMSLLIWMLIMNSCSKRAEVITGNNNTIDSTKLLIPIRPGNTWIYADTLYDTLGNVADSYIDTVVMTNETISPSNPSGYVFYRMKDSLGWFGNNNYVTNYPSNDQILMINDRFTSTYPIFTFPLNSSQRIYSGTITDSSTNCNIDYLVIGNNTASNIGSFASTRNSINYTNCKGQVLLYLEVFAARQVGITQITEYDGFSTNNGWVTVPVFKQKLLQFIPAP